MAHAAGDAALLQAIVGRRLTGEPLAWITGRVSFCDLEIRVEPGVYVPRWHTEQLARRAVELLGSASESESASAPAAAAAPAAAGDAGSSSSSSSSAGVAVDLCTGSGAIAKTLSTWHPSALVVASDLDARAVACARANGVEAYCGDLFEALPDSLHLEGRVDLVVAVVPYVPTSALALLQRDTLTFESTLSYDGGPDGTAMLARVVAESPRFLRPGGVVLLELGGEESDVLEGELARLGYVDVAVLLDDEDDIRGLEATWAR